MDFSIILASRGRTALLTNLLRSIAETTTDLSKIEVLVGIDTCDPETQRVCAELVKQYSFFQFHVRNRSHMLNKDYLNWISTDISRGKYLIIGNDDVEFETKGWDQIILDKLFSYLKTKPDGIVYGFIDDGLTNRHGLGYGCFPLISREGMRALGFAMPPEYPAWGADVAIWKIYARVDRICDLSKVVLRHISHHNGNREEDEVNRHVRHLSRNHLEVSLDMYTEKLKSHMSDKPIIDQVRNHYNKVISYHQQIGYDTKLDPIWSNNMGDIAGIVANSKSAVELIDRIDQTFMYAINFPPENAQGTGMWKWAGDLPQIRHKLINWLLKNQKRDGVDVFSMPENIQESVYVHDRNKVVRNGKVLTGNFLRTLSIADRIFRTVDKSKIKHILELGGGCGHQMRTLALMVPDCKYTIVDLPETLLFSFSHISLNFPEKKILFVSSEEDLAKIDDHDFVFVPAVFAGRLAGRSYDLFINTASMGEMRNDIIHYWMDFIQNRVNIKYLFTLNRYLNLVDRGLAQHRKSQNECSTSYDHKWNILRWELEPIYCRCPYIDTLHSRYLEILAERPEKVPTSGELIRRSDDLCSDVKDEDWFRLRGQFGNGLMQARTNVLVNDMTMEGTLFKLWESIRLNQTVDNVNTMLMYLRRITVASTPDEGHAFEETYYYEDLLRRLQEAK